MRSAACLIVAFVCSGAFASQPGQPLSFEDWQVTDPTYSLELVVPPMDCSAGPTLQCTANTAFGLDANGYFWTLRKFPWTDQWGNRQTCLSQPLNILQVVRCNAGYSTCNVVASAYERCYFRPEGGVWCPDVGEPQAVWIDSSNGYLYFRYQSAQPAYCSYLYPPTSETIRVRGLPTTFEVLQSYTPVAGGFAFRVPYMPEGMPGADHFDTYWGPLAHPIDFTQAQPLSCDYPTAAPHVGDYLTVPDTVATPTPGQGVYYVTSATYQGATRYGRKTTGGHVAGRDPALLPACVP